MKIILRNFRVIDEENDVTGSVTVTDGIISSLGETGGDAAMVIDGRQFSLSDGRLPVLMPAFVDLHAHFRDPGLGGTVFPAEMLESASLAAAAGGFGTVLCMANSRPPIDTIEKAASLKARSDALGLISLYPVISLTKGMEGKELSEIAGVTRNGGYVPLMLSEDGKDLADDELFLAAMREAKRLGVPVSCHCDMGGSENDAVRRVIELGKKAGCHIHIAHVSTRDAIETIVGAKAWAKANAKAAAADTAANAGGFKVTCEAMPHHLCLTKEDAAKLGENSHGRVNPPLRSDEDRQALIRAAADGIIDAIATDHAPHSKADKEAGAPGFSGFETAFAAVYTELVRGGVSAKSGAAEANAIGLKQLSSLMSARPARLLSGKSVEAEKQPGLNRGRVLPGCRADLVIVDTEVSWIVDLAAFKSRGKNSPFAGRELYGKILMTLHSGRVVYV